MCPAHPGRNISLSRRDFFNAKRPRRAPNTRDCTSDYRINQIRSLSYLMQSWPRTSVSACDARARQVRGIWWKEDKGSRLSILVTFQRSPRLEKPDDKRVKAVVSADGFRCPRGDRHRRPASGIVNKIPLQSTLALGAWSSTTGGTACRVRSTECPESTRSPIGATSFACNRPAAGFIQVILSRASQHDILAALFARLPLAR
jgi:hypothetical protein